MISYLSKTPHSKLNGIALLRLDFNTEDDWRMEAALPTIKLLARVAEKVVIISHRGRPKGVDIALSLASDAKKLATLLKRPVCFIPHFNWIQIQKELAVAPAHSVFLLENLRFLPEEEKNSPVLARELASLADYYVNDAFSVSHRANASISAITRFLPSYAGLVMEREIASLSTVMRKPKRPLVVILGGGKAADKLGVISYFQSRADSFLLGGAPANTFLYLKGIKVDRSLMDTDAHNLKTLRQFLKNKKIILPLDWKESQGKILDIGKESISLFASIVKRARTIIWSGPLGLVEQKKFAGGSLALARAITANKKIFSLVGGGETVMFLKKYGLDKKIHFISTGGGAMLDFLAGTSLPGITALEDSSFSRKHNA